jgi:tight adherence protein C
MTMMTTLLIILTLLTIVVVGFLLYHRTAWFAIRKRIDQAVTPEIELHDEELQKSFVERVILPLGAYVSKLLHHSVPGERAERITRRLVMAGLHPPVMAMQLEGLCWVTGIAGAALMIILILTFSSGPIGRVSLSDPYNLFYLIVSAVSGYTIPQFVLSKRVAARQEAILVALPYAIDMLAISVEAGMGFDAAVGYTMRKLKGPLAEEFAKTLNEIRLGKPRLDALQDLGNRTGVEDLKAFITAVVHASRLGGNITHTLRAQCEGIRVRRRQRAQEAAMKAPAKLVFPLVLCIFPALLIVILGPPMFSVSQALLKTMK